METENKPHVDAFRESLAAQLNEALDALETVRDFLNDELLGNALLRDGKTTLSQKVNSILAKHRRVG